MTAQDLKNSILQQAIQGKLLPQNPDDEPASELLKKISAQRQKLIAEGKIKKEKPLPPIKAEEIPFDIPDSWQWVRLGEIGETNIGLTYSPNDISTDGVVVLRSGNIQNGKIDYSDIVKVSSEIPENKFCRKGDILICARNGSKKLVGKAAIIDRDNLTFGAFMAKFRSQFNEYILFVINSPHFRKTLSGDVGTMTINQITQDMLKNFLLPLPPLAEQKRIVEKLEEILPLVEKYGELEQRLTKLDKEFPDKMKKSLLQQAIQGKLTRQLSTDGDAKDLLEKIREEKSKLIAEGKIKKEKPLPQIKAEEIPFDIPENWTWVRLGEVGYSQTGTTPSTKNPEYFGKDIPFLKPPDIYNDHIEYGGEGLSLKGKKFARVITPNSVLMVCIGGSTGKTFLCDRAVCCNQQINTLTPFNGISDWYLLRTMQSPHFQTLLWSVSSGTATPIVNKEKWRKILIPLPPLAEQKRIVERLEELLPLCDRLKRE